MTMPDVNKNYVPQGFDDDEQTGKYLATGYMSDKTASRVYVFDDNGEIYYTQYIFGEFTTGW